MMKKRNSIVLVIVLICVNVLVAGFGGIAKVGTTAAQFLKIPIGTRAMGMGSAFVSVANDATALYWNPAGMTEMTDGEFSVMHMNWILGTSYDFIGLVIPVGRYGSIGVDAAFTSIGEMKVRTVDNPDGTGEYFDAGDLAIGLAYGKKLTDRFSFGVHGKYIQQSIWHMKASSMAVDIGVLYSFIFKDIKIGMSVSNFGTDMKLSGVDVFIYHDLSEEKMGSNDKLPAYLETTKYSLPLIFRVGVSAKPIKTSMYQLLVALDAVHPNDNVEDIHIGAELTFYDMIAVRTGYHSLTNDDAEESLNFGFGLKYKSQDSWRIFVDYAYSPYGRLGDVHRYTLGVNF